MRATQVKMKLALASALLLCSAAANAVPVTYLGADDSVSSLSEMVNAQAARDDFLSVAGALDIVDFESPLPADLTISGGTTVDATSCGALCGFNTTPGGTWVRELSGGSVSFSFTNPVDAFGFFVNGLQTDLVPQQTIEYVDGSSVARVIDMPPANGGGGAFVGFIDFGEMISSVTFNATNDILGFDDLRFGRSANDPRDPTPVPAPATLLLISLGLLAIAGARR